MADKKTAKKIMDQSITVPLSKMKPYPHNPRIGNVEEIAKSLQANGHLAE